MSHLLGQSGGRFLDSDGPCVEAAVHRTAQRGGIGSGTVPVFSQFQRTKRQLDYEIRRLQQHLVIGSAENLRRRHDRFGYFFIDTPKELPVPKRRPWNARLSTVVELLGTVAVAGQVPKIPNDIRSRICIAVEE